ncbi:MAG TPA: hypothetical protein VHE30_18210 [Polyangiaceae bacterium]|nr:hypothetical protein [Polyangiaceae bacterium]
MNESRRSAAGFAAAVALVLVGGQALASPRYGATLKRSLDLFYEPPCSLCHEGGDAAIPTGRDGGAPATTPFARSLERRGLEPDDDRSLEEALTRSRADAADSDGDGARDLDELAWGGNPNVPDLPSEPTAEPRQYGCAFAGSARPETSDVTLLGIAGSLLFCQALRTTRTSRFRHRSRRRRTNRGGPRRAWPPGSG